MFAAAKSVLDREGLPGVTIRKIAARAGVSPMALYRHFEDKDAVLNALMEDGLREWEQIARSLTAQDPIRWLEQLAEAYLEFALTQPHRFDAAFFLPAPEARRYRDDFVASRSPVMAMARARIEQAKAEGRLGAKPALEVGVALSAFAQGFVSMYRAGRFSNEKQFRELYGEAIRHLLESFSTGRAEPKSPRLDS